MKLKSAHRKISFIFAMLIVILTLFSVNNNVVNAEEISNNIWNFDYTGDYQTFTAPVTGRYKIELWGAQGGSYNELLQGGKGAYTSGIIEIEKNKSLYIYVGGKGGSNDSLTNPGGYNGGGYSGNNSLIKNMGGGGATDVRLVSGLWNAPEGLNSRIMVAGGGGGTAYSTTYSMIAGHGGNLIGGSGGGSYTGAEFPTGGTQTSGGTGHTGKQGSFGYAVQSNPALNGGSGGGGGSGYYGGAMGHGLGGAGGSSYISGYLGCIAITSETNATPKQGCTYGTSDIACSYHYSNMIFEDATMIAGNEEMPTYDGTSTQIGNIDNGYAKITLLSVNSEDNYLSELTSDYGTLSPKFDPLTNDYTLTLDKYDTYFTLDGTLSDENASILGLGKYNIENGETKTINIIVTSTSGDIRTYTIEATRQSLQPGEHSSKLSKLEIERYEADLNPEFHSLINSYDLRMVNGKIDLNVIAETYDSEATVKIEGNKYLKNDTGIITITVSEPHSEPTIYTINYEKGDLDQKSIDFDYTGDYQTFTAPITGRYKIELWGAQGGSYNELLQGGKGAYTSGIIEIEKNKSLYIYVGGKGGSNDSLTNPGGYNGGGYSGNNPTIKNMGGGGATDVRLVSGLWNAPEGLNSRIMVAGGGGGTAYSTTYSMIAGHGGNLIGGSGGGSFTGTGISTTGGTQTSGGTGYTGKQGSFGYAVQSNPALNGGSGGGGGSGYYGGAMGHGLGGAGGSSYISGYLGCIAITSETNATPKEGCTDGTNDITCSYHYSNIIFEDATMIAGNEEMPTYDGASTRIGNIDNGYAKITPLSVNSEDNYLSELTSDYGTLSPKFDPLTNDYTLTLDKYDTYFTLDGTLSDENASILGLGKYNIENGETKTINIIVTSTSGDIRTYTIEATRQSLQPGEHSSKLSKLEIERYETDLNPKFHSLINDYEITIMPNELDLNVIAETYDSEATIKIEGNKYIRNDTGVITITVSEPNIEDTIYTIKYTKGQLEDEYTYDYTGSYQMFTAPITGEYKIELWGARGGAGRADGKLGSRGQGAYTSGSIKLNANETIYIYVGYAGSDGSGSTGGAGGWNGGAKGGNDGDNDPGGGGGGATDIRLIPTSDLNIWNEFDSLKSRIMIAGGAGGGRWDHAGGVGRATGNNVNSSGNLGLGTVGISNSGGSASGYGGGGGGYFGGTTPNYDSYGGTSYVSGSTEYDHLALTEDSTIDKLELKEDSVHYSGRIFEHIVALSGNEEMPTYDGTSTMIGNSGNGYAKISFDSRSKDNYLTTIEIDKGELTPEFDPFVNEYNVELDVNDTEIKIEAILSSDLAVIEGLGTHKVPGGTTTYPITVTSENGDIRIYNVNVTRPSSSESKPKNIEIKGLVPSICDEHAGYCELTPTFNPETYTYQMKVPAGIQDLEFIVEKSHDYQTVTGDGVIELSEDKNTITIEITSEDENNVSTYTYEIIRDMTGDNYIDKLEIIEPSIDIGFNYLITEYSFKVENEVTSLQMNIVLDDENASYEVIGNSDFEVGNNIVEIRVIAENGEERSYILNVYRLSNSNPLLSDLTVTNGETNYILNPKFKDITTNYTLTVGNEVESIILGATAQEDTTSISGLGNKTLNVGLNEFKVITTSEDGTLETYTLMITREKSRNNYISNLIVSEGTLTPAFNKETDRYSITIGQEIEKLTLEVLLEDETSKYVVSGNSNFKVGDNLVTIKVTAENGEERNYYIVVTKEGSDNNYLSNLVVSEGTLTPVFDKTIQEYEVVVEEGTTKIEVTGTAEDETSVVTGFGTYNVDIGVNTINIEVISESGELRIYKVNVIRNISSNTNITNLTPSSGILSPTFDNDTLEYELKVDKDTNIVDFNVELESNVASVSGNKNILVDSKEKQISIIVTAEDGTEKVITITILKESAVEDILLKQDNIMIGEGEEHQIEASVIPEDVINKELMYVSSDETIVSVDENGKIIGNKIGSAVITITSKDNINIEKTLIVNVVLKEIKSDIYDVIETDEGKIVIGADAGETIGEFIEKLLNDSNTIEIYDKDNNKIDDYSDIVKTGLIVKLVINNIEHDRAIMIVRGDINEDGIINITDKVILQNHILLKELIEDYRKYAAELEIDDVINVSDNVKLGDYILRKISSLN